MFYSFFVRIVVVVPIKIFFWMYNIILFTHLLYYSVIKKLFYFVSIKICMCNICVDLPSVEFNSCWKLWNIIINKVMCVISQLWAKELWEIIIKYPIMNERNVHGCRLILHHVTYHLLTEESNDRHNQRKRTNRIFHFFIFITVRINWE